MLPPSLDEWLPKGHLARFVVDIVEQLDLSALIGLPWQERFSEPPPLCEPADALERMRHRLKTRAGRASYGQRKQTVEPVFGIAGMLFRQFWLASAGFRPCAESGRW